MSFIQKSTYPNSRSLFTATFFYILYVAFLCVTMFNVTDDWRFLTNRANVMAPLIDTHSLILVVRQPAYAAGDLISFYAPSGGRPIILTHRIHRLGGNLFLTETDPPQKVRFTHVLPRNIIGKVTLIIPLIGSYLDVATTPFALILTVFLPIIYLLYIEVVCWYRTYTLIHKKIDFKI